MGKKTQQQENNDLLIAFILDKSGSMASWVSQTVDGFNSFVNDQRKNNTPTLFSLTLFNTKVEQRYTAVPLDQVEALTSQNYRPGGNTALYDAIGDTIRSTEASGFTGRILFVIQTDGQENSSKEWTYEAISALIDQKRHEQWTFAFMGADQDAFATSASLNIPVGNTLSYSSQNTANTYSTSSRGIAGFAEGGKTTTSTLFHSDEVLTKV